jgi:uncharacterized protein YlaI
VEWKTIKSDKLENVMLPVFLCEDCIAWYVLG